VLIVIWGTTWAAIRISLNGFPPLTGLALRFAVAGVVMMVTARLTGVRLGGSRREIFLWLIQAVLTFSVAYSIVYWAEQWVPSGLTAVLFSTFPLFVALLTTVMLPEERPTLAGIAGVMVGFGGVAVIFSDDLDKLGGPQVMTASLVLLISPLCAAIGNLAVKRWGKGIPSLTLTAVPITMTAALVGGVAALTERHRSIDLAPGPVAAVLYLALIGTAVAFTLYFWLLHHVRATQLSLIAYGVPVVAVAVGTLTLDEPITTRMLLGSALVVLGVGFAMRPARAK
jgi:drug/metabolite transporter (DMT)-like permease